MKAWKSIFKKFLFLPGWIILLLTVFSTIALTAVFVKGLEETIPAYVVYVLSAYSLTTVCIFLSKILPGYYKSVKQKLRAHPYGNKYITDISYKVRVSLYLSLGINLLYSVFKLASGILYSSFWWGAIAVYYILLSVIRFLLLRYMRNDSAQNRIAEYRRYRLCGMLLVLLNLSLSGIVFQMVWQNKAYTYPEVIIIASAAYTFYTVTVSIIDIAKYRKYKSPVISASKAIRFAAALVSLLSLETAMLVQYGKDESFRRLMTALTGAGVCLIVLGISIFMIIRANKELQKMRRTTFKP